MRTRFIALAVGVAAARSAAIKRTDGVQPSESWRSIRSGLSTGYRLRPASPAGRSIFDVRR